MDLQQAKTELVEKFNDLKKFIIKAECYFYEDLDIPEDSIRLSINDTSEVETYEYDCLEKMADLDRSIKIFKIFETKDESLSMLVEWMIFELSFDQYETNFIRNDIPHKVANSILSKIYEQKIMEYSEIRKQIHTKLISEISKYAKIETVHEKKTRAKIEKLKWLGEQYHLVELFRELEQKGWIEKISNVPTENARAILEAFDISNTKKKESSKPEASFFKAFIGYQISPANYIYPGHPLFEEEDNYKPQFKNLKVRSE